VGVGEQATRIILRDGRKSPKEFLAKFKENKPFDGPLAKTIGMKWNKDHELGWEIVEVGGKRSKYYHFVIIDEKTGKKYMPYVEVEDEKGGKKRVYLDFRNMLFDPDFMRGKIIEIFLVYDHRDIDNSVKTRYDGQHAWFMLDEFTTSDLRMADIGRMMKKYYLGNPGEDCRFHFMELRARMLMETGRGLPLPSPVFSFDGLAFSFSLPASEAEGEVPAAVREEGIGAAESVMLLESKSWFDASAGRHVVQGSVSAMIAKMPVLSESLAVAEFPSAAKVRAQKLVVVREPRAQKSSVQMEIPSEMHAAGMVAPCEEILLETDRAEPKAENYSKGRDNGEVARNSGSSKTYATDEGEDGDSRGKSARKKSPFKPVPITALSSFKAAIFDLDGVIVDSEMVHPRTFERALEKYWVKITDRHWKREYTGIGSYAIFDDLVKKYGIRESARELAKRRNEIYLAEIKRNKLPVIEGFPEVHRLLAENGVKEAVASGGHANHVQESLRSAGIGNLPFVAIEHVRAGKPSPEIFLRAARRLRAKPSECIVFEDSLSGTEAAARAGMSCVALATTLPAGELRGKAALVVKNFRSKKLKKLLSALLAGRKKKGNAREKVAPKRRRSAGRRRN
jgi:HAD superfamily hydrolase (TIGR01509 family)